MTDDIKAIRDALAAAKKDAPPWAALEQAAEFWCVANPERIARLLDALEQAQKDAARWRWLRQHLSGDGPMISEAMRVIDQEYGWELDPAIDAALKRGA